jgi:hypothetical protein
MLTRGRALVEIGAIPLFYPGVRARLVGSVDDLSPAERRRVVESWTARYPEQWVVLAGAVRDVEVAEDALVTAALRAAAGDAKPCDPAGLAEIEAYPRVHPGNALAAVIPPSTVWDYEIALEAAEAVAAEERMPAIAAIGFGRFATCAERLRERVAWVERQLPFPAYPHATRTLRAGCDLVAARDGLAELGCAVLEGYVRLLESGFPAAYITPRN